MDEILKEIMMQQRSAFEERAKHGLEWLQQSKLLQEAGIKTVPAKKLPATINPNIGLMAAPLPALILLT